MSSLSAQYALFLAEAVTLVLAIIALLAVFTALSRRRRKEEGRIEVTDVNRRLEAAGDRVEAVRLSGRPRKRLLGQRRRERKARLEKAGAESCFYLLDFKGDLRASALAALREEINAVLQVAKPGDEVLLRLESGGGLVNRYGLAAAQLLRLRKAQLPLTVMVDAVAAAAAMR